MKVILEFPVPIRELDKNHRPAHWAVRAVSWNRALRDAHNEILAQLEVPGLRDWEPIDEPVWVRCTWRHREDHQRPDYDNAVARLSPTFDALESAAVLENDHLIEDVRIQFEPVPAGRESITLVLWTEGDEAA